MANEKLISSEKLITAIRDDLHIDGRTFARVKRHIEDAPVVQKWIPVTERLPQEDLEMCKNVNLLMDDGFVTVGWLNQSNGKVYYIGAYHDFVENAPISRCTHWMPLPEAPKGE